MRDSISTNDPRRRQAAVAGLFYPNTGMALRAQVESLLAATSPSVAAPRPRALIVPHAGYLYSGAAAAAAYRCLVAWRQQIRRIVVLGPPHRMAIDGLASSGASAFVTPLGEVPVDQSELARWCATRAVAINDAAHYAEHSIEVQLPFLQTVLEAITLLPLLVAEPSAARLADLLAPYWERDDTLLVVSTDLSHFLDYASAQRTDRETDAAIMNLDAGRIGPRQACGCHALNGLLALAARRAAHIERLALCNSGDTAGSRDRVVGYAAYLLH